MGLVPCLCNVVLVSTHIWWKSPLSWKSLLQHLRIETPSLASPARWLAAPLIFCVDLMSLHAQSGYLIRWRPCQFLSLPLFSLEIRTCCACCLSVVVRPLMQRPAPHPALLFSAAPGIGGWAIQCQCSQVSESPVLGSSLENWHPFLTVLLYAEALLSRSSLCPVLCPGSGAAACGQHCKTSGQKQMLLQNLGPTLQSPSQGLLS